MTAIIDEFSNILPYLDGRSFNENMSIRYSSHAKVEYRIDVLEEICRDKKVIHVGCCDHVPLIKSKIAQHNWLHGIITDCSKLTVGIDIDQDAVNEASRISGLKNIFVGDITSEKNIEQISNDIFDIALFGEVLEHISNPVDFLSRFRKNYGDQFRSIVITVPNAFRAGNIKGIMKNTETINSDHRFFFTPYTIAKVALDAGFMPKEIRMATFTRAGPAKTMILNQKPLLAEDIIFIGFKI